MSTFVANENLAREGTNPKDWAYHLGCLPQSHHIVFTKSSFIDFLRQHQITVGPNFTELSNLPKYAVVGKFTSDPAGSDQAPQQENNHAPTTAGPAPPSEPSAATSSTRAKKAEVEVLETSSNKPSDSFRPTRRVREAVGGGSQQIASLFGDEEEPAKPVLTRKSFKKADDPFAESEIEERPPRRPAAQIDNTYHTSKPRTVSEAKAIVEELPQAGDVHAKVFRPTRRVREPGGTGGASSITFDY
ncbi:hypothetical protein IE53DRAFT_385033 [Violaceomyces palustris]|uniref:Uncharacterized protein n=1 Tax=Violaceomyces palustris TaxID=1673888 RepID=A0ACD0P3C9_9BASI|nr:hypothetical protein IE53DRAFT_385033 [Violaceomyces palustris]